MNKSTPVIFSIMMFAFSLPLMAAEEEGLIQSLSSQNPLAQIEACRQLGEDQNKDAIAPLIQLMENTGDDQVAAAAAAALGAIGEKGEATTAILRVASKTDSAGLQYASVAALANLKDEEQKEDVMNLLARIEENSGDELLKDLASKVKTLLSK